jgi:hypothetical protein
VFFAVIGKIKIYLSLNCFKGFKRYLLVINERLDLKVKPVLPMASEWI